MPIIFTSTKDDTMPSSLSSSSSHRQQQQQQQQQQTKKKKNCMDPPGHTIDTCNNSSHHGTTTTRSSYHEAGRWMTWGENDIHDDDNNSSVGGQSTVTFHEYDVIEVCPTILDDNSTVVTTTTGTSVKNTTSSSSIHEKKDHTIQKSLQQIDPTPTTKTIIQKTKTKSTTTSDNNHDNNNHKNVVDVDDDDSCSTVHSCLTSSAYSTTNCVSPSPQLQSPQLQLQQLEHMTPVLVDDDDDDDDTNHSAVEMMKKSTMMNKTTTRDTKKTNDRLFASKWTQFILHHFHRPILSVLTFLASISMKSPWLTIGFLSIFSFFILGVGYVTNFNILVSEDILWTPMNSKPAVHRQYIHEISNFPMAPRPFILMFHNHGQNIMNVQSIQKIFHVMDTIMELESYQQICSNHGDVNLTNPFTNEILRTCFISSVTRFWSFQSNMFENYVTQVKQQELQQLTNNNSTSTEENNNNRYVNEQIGNVLSANTYPDGGPVFHSDIYGKTIRNQDTNQIESIQAFSVFFALPEIPETMEVELLYVEIIQKINEQWQQEQQQEQQNSTNNTVAAVTTTVTNLSVECIAKLSFQEEFLRGILSDMFLIPVVFVVMTTFAGFYFHRQSCYCCFGGGKEKGNRNHSTGTSSIRWIHSRTLLGFSAVVCVLFSIFTGYGFVFIVGTPFTSITQLVPFIIFGVGLDDAFILIDSFERTNPNKTPEQRIYDTIQDCGFSITLTTLTSATAFAIGSFSSIPGIAWLCVYASISILFVLLYQITFFVACIVIDENRIRSRRYDLFPCCIRGPDFQTYAQHTYDEYYNNSNNNDNNNKQNEQSIIPMMKKKNFTYRSLEWFTRNVLLHPIYKILILIAFVVFTGFATWSTTQMEQKFDFTDVLPNDSYISDLVHVQEMYGSRSLVRPGVFFRNENFADPYVQDQMILFAQQIQTLQSVTNPPDSFWLYDFQQFVVQQEQQLNQTNTTTDITNLTNNKETFNEQLRLFLLEPTYYDLHHRDLVFDTKGNLVESRFYFYMDALDTSDIHSQITALQEQDTLTRNLPINQGKTNNYSFFIYANAFDQFEFYSVCVNGLISSTIIGILSVTIMTILLIPHWTAALYTTPIVCMMYIDIMGILQWAGITINAISFVALVMSIGLIVDYIMHILLRFYETGTSGTVNRHDQTINTLCTMGSSVLAGGISTFLGTLPLLLSSSKIFYTVFVTFFSLVVVAIAYGLIFLPILLSMYGPVDVYTLGTEKKDDLNQTHSTKDCDEPALGTVKFMKRFSC